MDRLQADDDIRQLTLLGAVTSDKSFKDQLGHLRKTLGEIAVYEPVAQKLVVANVQEAKHDPEFDRGGLHALAGLGRTR